MIGEKLCEHCQRPFYPNKFWQKYCTNTCARAAHYIRKAQRPLDYLHAEITNEPTEAQKAEWESRQKAREVEDRETISKKAQRSVEIAEKAEQLLHHREHYDNPADNFLTRMFGTAEDKEKAGIEEPAQKELFTEEETCQMSTRPDSNKIAITNAPQTYPELMQQNPPRTQEKIKRCKVKGCKWWGLYDGFCKQHRDPNYGVPKP